MQVIVLALALFAASVFSGPVPSSNVRPIDAAGTTGQTDSLYLRRDGVVAYADGCSEPSGGNRPNVRDISNKVMDVPNPDTYDRDWTSLFTFLGQFIDHDLTLSATNPRNEHFVQGEPFLIDIPADDTVFTPGSTMQFTRTNWYDDQSGSCVRQHANGVTSLLDLSMVYGSNANVAGPLRSFTGGLMVVSDDNMLPRESEASESGYLANCFKGSNCFATGDKRGNENLVLTALHTIFVREHNRLANEFAKNNPKWSDEDLYQNARRINIAQWQMNVFKYYLPGVSDYKDCLKPYYGFNSKETAQISVEFATAAFRFGHSSTPANIELVNSKGTLEQTIPLDQAFFNPSLLTSKNIAQTLFGASKQQIPLADVYVNNELRNMLFKNLGNAGGNPNGLDLASLNLQRGRDHALLSYNEIRAYYGFSPKGSFSDITPDSTVAKNLEGVYKSVDDTDLYVTGLAEPPLGNTNMLGELFSAINCEQFARIRDADPWWWEAPGILTPTEASNLKTLGEILTLNLPGYSFPTNPLLF